MKAKDMAELYKNSPSKLETLGKMIMDMLAESKVMLNKRKTLAGCQSVTRELELRWAAFARLANDPCINPHGFRDMVLHLVPDAKDWFTTKRT